MLFGVLYALEELVKVLNFFRLFFVPDGQQYKSKLLGAVKKEVKQIMEEAVTKKFVHEESGSVTSLCAAVEACLSQGLRRRALGLFKTSSTTALLHKVILHLFEINADDEVIAFLGGKALSRSCNYKSKGSRM